MDDSSYSDDDDRPVITYVEFYAGIGGWSMALQQALKNVAPKWRLRLRRLAALDHSDLCLKVLQHNYASKHTRTVQVSIEKLTLEQLHRWSATIFVMSPPCQPHTRQHGNQKLELDDPRSQSFLHLCDLLEEMDESKLPSLLLLENVVGFEVSGSCQRWREMLANRNYHVGHFHLQPTQVGIPNDRPRYYCVAARSPDNVFSKENVRLETNAQAPPMIQTDFRGSGSPEQVVVLPPISEFLDDTATVDEDSLRIPEKLLESRASWCFDIVTPQDQRSACFTQSYGKFIRGTGSVLWTGDLTTKFQLVPPEERQFNSAWKDGLNLHRNLRYFSGTEVARLMGFHLASFSFPKDFSFKQQWKLLGNSLNVQVAASVSELGLRLIMKHRM
jgi:tRNA (cytosine38-C5)-methyltransferase